MKTVIMLIIVGLITGNSVAVEKSAGTVIPKAVELKSKNYRMIAGPISTANMFEDNVVIKSSSYMLTTQIKKEEVILLSLFLSITDCC